MKTEKKKQPYGSLTEEAVNLSQMNSSSKCLLSGIHRRNNYSSLGQTAISSQQSSILGWQEYDQSRPSISLLVFFSLPPQCFCGQSEAPEHGDGGAARLRWPVIGKVLAQPHCGGHKAPQWSPFCPA